MLSEKKLVGKFIWTLMIVLLAVSFILSLCTMFFQTHFYPDTVINGVKVAYLTSKDADKRLKNEAFNYQLALKERGDMKEIIKGAEIGAGFDLSRGSSFYKEKQNKSFWIFAYFNKKSLVFDNAFTYDEDLLFNRLNQLQCLDASKITLPRNATLTYVNGRYEIIREEYGNQVARDLLLFYMKSAVRDGKQELDMERVNCYVNPTILHDSPKILNTKITADRYVASKIIYQHPAGIETASGEDICRWIGFDDNLNIIFNREEIGKFLNALATHYDTVGKEREFITSYGKKITIGGGDFGWKVDVKGETEAVIDNIVKGGTVVKEPKYSQTGASRDLNDIGLTYVEINLSKQHLWYYDEGVIVAHGAVVTGNMSRGHKTPEGIYSLKYKIKNAVLKGENYRVGVSYWMPFNNDIGIHDAAWRSEFGRDIYLTRGSHGCVNVAYSLAKTLYENINVGTPVVCYY